jgi:hypothetical protein
MANELDAAQRRGEVATKGERANTRSSGISGYNDLGIDSRRVADGDVTCAGMDEAADWLSYVRVVLE